MAELALARGAAATAARLVGAAAASVGERPPTPTEAESPAPGRPRPAPATASLGGSAAERERHAGRTMPAAAVLELAAGSTAVGTEAAAAVELTPRQLEVAALVAAGRTNRQIGTALGISEKTTEIHVHNLMSRLDVPSRAGVAAWAAARGLDPTPDPVGVSPYGPDPAVARRQRSGRNTAARTRPTRPLEGHDMDEDKLNEMLGRFVGDLGATITAGGVVIGHRLGLYRALADGPGTAEEVARRTGCDPRYVAEWLRGQGAGGYVTYDAEGDTWSLTEEQAFVLANPDGAVYAPGAYVLALGSLQAIDRIEEAFKTGAGVGWHEHDDEVFVGCEQFFRPGYLANLVPSWIPALDGVQAKLEAGAKVADVGCGLGASTILLAEQFPQAQLVGCDYHEESIELARKRAADAGVGERITFEIASAQDFGGSDFDLVATFDCLHDMGDPVGAARHIRQSLADDGTWLIVEPIAGDTVADNLNPVGRVYYGFSTFLCVPNALSQSGGYSLGAQAGEKAIGEVVAQAGFTRFRRAAETPFNLVFEARP